MAKPNGLIGRREFLVGGGLLTLSACTTPFGLRNSTQNTLKNQIENSRVLVGAYLAASVRDNPANHTATSYQPVLNSEICVLNLDNKSSFRFAASHYPHEIFQSPTNPMILAGCMKWGEKAGIWNLADLNQSFDIQAPEGCHFYGHGTFTGDGKTLIFSAATDETGEGRLVHVDVSTGRIFAQTPSHGRVPHEIKWIKTDEVLLIAQSPIEKSVPRKGRLTHLNLKTGGIEFEFDNELCNSHILRTNSGLISCGSSISENDEAIWYLVDEKDKKVTGDFRKILGTLKARELFTGEALSQRVIGDTIFMTTARGNRLYAWNPKKDQQTHLQLPMAILGLEVHNGSLLFNAGNRGDLYEVKFNEDSFLFSKPELQLIRFANCAHLQNITT